MIKSMYRISIKSAAMSSFTVTLTGQSSELSSTFFPEIVLDENSEYSCGLLDLTTFHSIPNITWKNDTLVYIKDEKKPEGYEDIPEHQGKLPYDYIPVPTGSYEAAEILDYLKDELKKRGITFLYGINKNTLKTSIKCSVDLLFNFKNSVHKMFGFKCIGIKNGVWTESEDIIRISNQDIIRVECNIVSGSFINGKRCHSIYEFPSNKVNVGYKIIEQPKNIIYLPVVPRRINYIQISFVDQNGENIDFRGENITCRIHIKKE